jgi:hypothetical protein
MTARLCLNIRAQAEPGHERQNPPALHAAPFPKGGFRFPPLEKEGQGGFLQQGLVSSPPR